MNILITGGAGFIGSHLVDWLVNNTSHHLRVYDNFSRGSSNNLAKHTSNSNVEVWQADLLDTRCLKEATENIEIIFHLAAQASVLGSVRDENYTFQTNVVGTHLLLETARLAGVRRVIFSSSREVYGEVTSLPVREDTYFNAKNGYGVSKVTGELYCNFFRREYNLDVVVLRFANVYGERDFDRVIPIWLQRATQGGDLPVYGGQQIIDFVYVDQVVQALWKAATLSNLDLPTNIGSGIGTTLLVLAETVSHLAEPKRCRLRILPANPQEVTRYIADVSRMKTILGIIPPADPLFALPGLARQVFDLEKKNKNHYDQIRN